MDSTKCEWETFNFKKMHPKQFRFTWHLLSNTEPEQLMLYQESEERECDCVPIFPALSGHD